MRKLLCCALVASCVLAVSVAGCGANFGPCGAGNCSGCCSGDSCVAGTTDFECGHGAVKCVSCAGAAPVCSAQGNCVARGGSGGGGGGGGGTAGGSNADCALSCAGCCRSGFCLIGSSMTACGRDGALCTDCSAQGARCNSWGHCTQCGSSSCSGCCAEFGTCFSANIIDHNYCGLGGVDCKTCPSPQLCTVSTGRCE